MVYISSAFLLNSQFAFANSYYEVFFLFHNSKSAQSKLKSNYIYLIEKNVFCPIKLKTIASTQDIFYRTMELWGFSRPRWLIKLFNFFFFRFGINFLQML